MSLVKLALAVLFTASTASVASATVFTQSYTTTATFSSGPVASLTQSFTLTYDPLETANELSVDAYSSSTTNTGFNVPVVLNVLQGNGFHRVLIGGSLNGADAVYSNTNDFFTYFYVDANGNPLNGVPTTLAYSNYGDSSAYSSVNSMTVLAAVDAPSSLGSTYMRKDAHTNMGGAVPEPASWALMLAGFGLIGGALRRQRRAVSFA